MWADGGRDRGSAAVDFVLVGSLLTLFFLALLQLGIDLYVRNTLAGCAAEGARYAAAADIGDAGSGAAQTRSLIRSALGTRYAGASVTPSAAEVDGRRVIAVTVTAHLPLLAWFLPTGPTVTVTGHALVEGSA